MTRTQKVLGPRALIIISVFEKAEHCSDNSTKLLAQGALRGPKSVKVGPKIAHPGVRLVHGQRVDVEVVVDDHIEAVGRQEAHKVEEARVHVGVRQRVVAPANALRVARRLHGESSTVSQH